MKKSIIFLFTTIQAFIQYTSTSCPNTIHYENELMVEESITGFDQFGELNFKSCNKSLHVNTFKIEPNEQIILDDSLDFNGLVIDLPVKLFNIDFGRLKGIEMRANCVKNLKFTNNFWPTAFLWYFSLTKFDFYLYDELIDSSHCNDLDLFEINNHFMKEVLFLFLQKAVIYSDQTCPLIFHRTKIQVLNIESLYAGFVHKNILAFVNSTSISELESEILQLILRVFHYNLDNKLLNEHVFKNLNYLDINGPLTSIQTGLLKPLKMLKMLRFRTQNAKGLLTNKNKWLYDLNPDVEIDLKKHIDLEQYQDLVFKLVIFQTYSNVTYYDYPDEDFCFFKDFPHKRLVLPQLRPTFKAKCSCTELFLIQYSYLHKKMFESNFLLTNYYFLSEYYYGDVHELFFSSCVNSSINEILMKCNFEKRLQICNTISITRPNESYWYMLDWQELSKYSYVSFTLYVNPVVSFFCIFFNIALVRILSHRKLKKETRRFYVYLNLNLYSNIVFMLVHYVDLLFECTYVDYFCSTLKKTETLNYFKNVILKLVYNSLTTFSNFAYTAFVLVRFIKITNTKNEKLKRFEKLRLRYYLLFAVLFSVFINMFICFEYSSSFREAFATEIEVTMPLDYFKINMTETEQLVLKIFQFVKIIFSDLFFSVSSIVLDVALIVFIKRNSKKMKTALVRNATTSIQTQNNNNQTPRISDKKESSKRRLTAMIVLNGLNFLILRLPLALMDFYGLVVSLNLVGHRLEYTPSLTLFIVCRIFRFCDNLKGIFFSLHLLSFLVQFLIFYKLDNNFKEGFKNLKADLGTRFC